MNMKKFISLSQYPGKTGQHYYTKFFQKYNLPYFYEPIGTTNVKSSIDYALHENVAGISISMPFKKSVIEYLDNASQEVIDYSSCNTILIQNNKLIGHNADYYGALHAISYIKQYDHVAILGNGSMANMFYKMLKEYNVKIISRSLNNWNTRFDNFDVYINCTSLGTITSESPFNSLPKCRLVIDLALKENQLFNQCNEIGTKYLSGLEFYKHQFINQFKIYTGLNINAKEFDNI